VSSLLRAWGILACFDLAFAQPTILSSRKAIFPTCTKFWPFVGGIEGWSRAEFWASRPTSKGFWGAWVSFEKLWVFHFSPPRHILAIYELSPTNFWRLVALPEGFPKVSKYMDQRSSVSRKWGFPFLHPYHDFARKCTLFHRVMPQISSVWR